VLPAVILSPDKRHIHTQSPMHTSPFGLSCWIDGGKFEDARRLLAFFQFLPAWVAIFYYSLVFALSDIFFLIASFSANYIIFFYIDGLSHAFRSERPPAYDHVVCETAQFAVPDTRFVAALVFWILVSIGLVKHPVYVTHVGFLYRVLMIFLPIMYIVGLMVNEYFFWWQLIINIVVVFVVVYFYLVLYERFILFSISMPWWYQWMTKNTGYEVVLYCPRLAVNQAAVTPPPPPPQKKQQQQPQV